MKVVAVLGKMQAGVVEKPVPKPKDDIVVVKVLVAPMCTEYHAFEKGDLGDWFGHEAVGEVVEVDKATQVNVGDRVIVQPQTACGECYLCRTGDYIHCENNRDLGKLTGWWRGAHAFANLAFIRGRDLSGRGGCARRGNGRRRRESRR